MGTVMAQAIRYGIARGVFSNEAGLGSSVMVHSASDVKEPVTQGLWGIFEVFAGTIIVCTITALSVLTALPMETVVSMEGAAITMEAFTTIFGAPGAVFVSLSIPLFAFSTILGWSYYGQRSMEYLGGQKAAVYKLIFICMIVVGAMVSVQVVWDASEAFNGLMALPNPVGVLGLSPVVVKITRNYMDRKFHGKDIPPLLNYTETPLTVKSVKKK